MLNLTFGHDVEVFLTSSDTVIPSCGLIGGEKGRPVHISNELSVLEDNVTLELNGPPAGDSNSFLSLCCTQAAQLENYLSNLGYGFVKKASHRFDTSQLIHPRALSIGCEPDFDAFQKTGVHRPVFDIQEFGNTRFAGGHVHIGFPANYTFKVPPFVHVRFYAIGLALRELARSKPQGLRRKYYGSPGLFRLKRYGDGVSGIEYRSLTSRWFPNQFEYINNAHFISNFLESNPKRALLLHTTIPWADIYKIIMDDDQQAAHLKIRELFDTFPDLMGGLA